MCARAMVTVAPSPGRFADLSDEQRQIALSSMLVSQHDAILNGAYDHPDDDGRANGAAAASSSSSSSSPVHSSPRSSITSRSVSPLAGGAALEKSASSLLIRSKCQGWERSFELHSDWPVPRLERDDEVLIEHRSIGLNPVDFKSVLYNFGIPDAPWVLGRDIAGVVKHVGAGVSDVNVGDRVWTCADSRDVRSGAYQAFSIARSAHVGRISERLADEQAATLGTGLVTAAIAAYWFFQWPRALSLAPQPERMARSIAADTKEEIPSDKPWVLIYGGGAITGIFLAQLARLSGLRSIAVASPSNFDYLTSANVGVTHCVDRFLNPDRLAAAVQAITAEQGGDIRYVVDCVGAKTAAQCYDIAAASSSATSAQMICLAGDPKSPTTTDRAVQIHRISFSTTFYGDDAFARNVVRDLDALMQADALHPVRFEVVPDGLAGVRRGLERLRDNQAPRACKLVVNVSDTPHVHSTNLGVRAELGWNGVA